MFSTIDTWHRDGSQVVAHSRLIHFRDTYGNITFFWQDVCRLSVMRTLKDRRRKRLMGLSEIRQLLSGVRWIRASFYRIHSVLPDTVFFFFVNLLCKFSLINVRVRYGSGGGYLYTDNERSRYASDRLRGLRLWHRGFSYRDTQLIEKYGLAFVDLDVGDVVIDCGANYGDVYFALASLGKQVNYVAIEPDPTVRTALEKNITPDGRICGLALGAQNDDSAAFFISGMSGDSSVVKPDIVEKEVLVPMQTLTTLIEAVGLQKLGLLKLEAEGYEIEILRGAHDVLRRFRYVTVDGSAERHGIETLDDLRSILEQYGFNLTHHSARYISALFDRGR